MLKIGIIGKVSSMQSFVQQLKKEPDFEIIGKSSIGMIDQPAGALLSVPEYAKAALIEASDAIIIERPEMVNFEMIKEAIKKSKHLFLSDLPDISSAQCLELQKLAGEAGNVVQVRNPLLEDPSAGWIADHWQEPAYISIFEGAEIFQDKRSLLLKMLLYAQELFKASPQKIRVSGVYNQGDRYSFLNIRLDYATYSAINLELLHQSANELKIRAALPRKFLETAGNNQFYINHQKFHADPSHKNCFSSFLGNLKAGYQRSGASLSALHQVLVTYEDLLRKFSLYTPWYS
jgi:hypothetical protein